MTENGHITRLISCQLLWSSYKSAIVTDAIVTDAVVTDVMLHQQKRFLPVVPGPM